MNLRSEQFERIAKQQDEAMELVVSYRQIRDSIVDDAEVIVTGRTMRVLLLFLETCARMQAKILDGSDEQIKHYDKVYTEARADAMKG